MLERKNKAGKEHGEFQDRECRWLEKVSEKLTFSKDMKEERE